jgi:hypothetical protein
VYVRLRRQNSQYELALQSLQAAGAACAACWAFLDFCLLLPLLPAPGGGAPAALPPAATRLSSDYLLKVVLRRRPVGRGAPPGTATSVVQWRCGGVVGSAGEGPGREEGRRTGLTAK